MKYAVPYLLPKSFGLEIAVVHNDVNASVPATEKPNMTVNVTNAPKLPPDGNYKTQSEMGIIADMMTIKLKLPYLSERTVGTNLPKTPAALKTVKAINEILSEKLLLRA